MILRRFAICLALTAQVACASSRDPARGVESLLETDHEFARYSREHGAADAFDRYLADDAIQLPDRGEVIQGRVAIVDGLRALDDGWVLDWAPVHAEVSDDGRMGWTWGRYSLYRVATPDSRQLGKYLNVWRRGPDGRWRVAADMGNQAPPVPD
jgi:ketosteroid isomerase-like protein